MSCGEPVQSAEQSETSSDEATIESLTQKIDQFGGSGDDYYKRSRLHLLNREVQKAADDIMLALQQDSTNLEYLYLLSDIQISGLRSRDGLATMLQAVKLDANNRKSLLKLMETQILLRQYIPALGTSQRLLQIDPQDQETFFLRGLLFKEQNADSLAIVNFQRAVDIDPSMTGAFIVLGDLHEKKSDPLAEGYYKNAVASDPDHLNARHALAYYYQNHGKEVEAVQEYEALLTIDDSFQPAWINKGIVELRLDSVAQAKETLSRGVALDSNFTIGLYYLGLAEAELGNKEKGKELLQRALQIDPEYQAAQEALDDL